MKRSLIISFLMILIFGLTFIMEDILSKNREYRSNLILSVSNLETLNSSLNYEILYNQSFYHDNFDSINLKIERFNSLLNDLDENFNFNDEETVSIVNELKERFRNKEDLIIDLSSTITVIRSSINFLAHNFNSIKKKIDDLAEKNTEIKNDLYQYRRELEVFWLNELVEKTTNKGITFGNLEFPECKKCKPFLEKDINAIVTHLAVLSRYSEYQQEYSERLKRTNVELSINTLFIEIEYLINDAEERDIKQKIIIFITAMALILTVCVVFYFVHKSRKHQRISKTDLLTGFGNRNQLANYFELVKDNMDENGASFGLLFIDLDGFKKVNDVLGHSYGDIVLKTVATKLSLGLEEGQELIRYGGDEFIVILPNMSRDELNVFGHKLVQSGYFALQKDLTVSLSIGGVIYPDDAQTLGELIIKADKAMYESKQKGKNQFSMAS